MNAKFSLKLCLLFQCRDVDLSAIQPSLNATILAFKQYCEADVEAEELIGEDLSKFEISVSQAKKDEFLAVFVRRMTQLRSHNPICKYHQIDLGTCLGSESTTAAVGRPGNK